MFIFKLMQYICQTRKYQRIVRLQNFIMWFQPHCYQYFFERCYLYVAVRTWHSKIICPVINCIPFQKCHSLSCVHSYLIIPMYITTFPHARSNRNCCEEHGFIRLFFLKDGFIRLNKYVTNSKSLNKVYQLIRILVKPSRLLIFCTGKKKKGRR